ncbi:MAG: glycolate oxidase subunit GlcE [Methylococcaceae bacterium]
MALDLEVEFQQAINEAYRSKKPLQIKGGNSKHFLGREPTGQSFDVSSNKGIINYQPSELVVTARAGTTLRELEEVLAKQNQMLPFEPPRFASTATLGGTIATGVSGSRRPFTGSARDFVLGCKLINGKGEILNFGGEVIKNVAGFDVARLMVGAMGTLGVLLEVSMKVLPRPSYEQTRVFEFNTEAALATMSNWMNRSLSLSALCYEEGFLYARFAGEQSAIEDISRKLGGECLSSNLPFWTQLKEQQNDFFLKAGNLWRFSVPAAEPPINLSGKWLYDWGGGLRWIKTDEPANLIFRKLHSVKGHAQFFKGGDRSQEIYQPLESPLQKLNEQVKRAFDPVGILNPFRKFKQW